MHKILPFPLVNPGAVLPLWLPISSLVSGQSREAGATQRLHPPAVQVSRGANSNLGSSRSQPTGQKVSSWTRVMDSLHPPAVQVRRGVAGRS